MRMLLVIISFLNLGLSGTQAADFGDFKSIKCSEHGAREIDLNLKAQAPYLNIQFDMVFYSDVKNALNLPHRPPDGHHSGLSTLLEDIISSCQYATEEISCNLGNFEPELEIEFPSHSVFGSDTLILNTVSVQNDIEKEQLVFHIGLQKDKRSALVEITYPIANCILE